uniref:Uncharacterized protein n=1 Tax=Podoviridae sp. ctzeq1 TaxID=2826597 RepID=A0A8S5M0S0_9CAUD|nr:MAG TPA: hypothetical protein [Podoviridae sp. ctzeq1]
MNNTVEHKAFETLEEILIKKACFVNRLLKVLWCKFSFSS